MCPAPKHLHAGAYESASGASTLPLRDRGCVTGAPGISRQEELSGFRERGIKQAETGGVSAWRILLKRNSIANCPSGEDAL